MGGLEENIRHLNNYNTIFGSLWFNILCCTLNLIEIITSVVLLGYYHNVITIDYIWWPVIEMTRLFILSILRFDVMLKSVENYNDNRNGFRYTKRAIIICNLIGFFVILIGAPIYLALLSIPNKSNTELNTAYTIFMCIYPSFIIIRVGLTLPMYCILITGTNPLYSINHTYQMIDNNIATTARRRARRRRRSNGDGYNELDEDDRNDRYQRQIRRQLRIMQLEQHQMQLAIDRSRTDSFRQQRKAQDEEYKSALKQEQSQSDLNQLLNTVEEKENKIDIKSDINITSNISEEDILSSQTPSSIQDEPIQQQSQQTQHVQQSPDDNIILPPLPPEAEDNSFSLLVRIRLPNGTNRNRRFNYLSTVNDVLLWCHHECLKSNQKHLINNCRIASTHPHTVYDDMNKTMKDLKFWKPNSKILLSSPILYVE